MKKLIKTIVATPIILVVYLVLGFSVTMFAFYHSVRLVYNGGLPALTQALQDLAAAIEKLVDSKEK